MVWELCQQFLCWFSKIQSWDLQQDSQLSTNKMVQIGDWIEMPKYGADGDVIDIGLNVVKVRNFDKTITTIPTYALVSDSFKNYRGMRESGGRRIKEL